MIQLSTNYGPILIQLDHARAPKTCANFEECVREGQYDGTLFHRVIHGFMIQGGGVTENFLPKRTRAPIRNEAGNGLKNLRGTIAMARTADPHSANAQFFINLADNDFLDHPGQDGWGYCVFGRVVEGMETVDAIAAVKTGGHHGHQDVPEENVLIERAEIID